MPLLIQSLPLSFQTFWRYLLLLPLLAVFAILFWLIAGLIPLFGFLVPGTLSAFFVLCGLRCALVARGYGGEADLGAMLRFSVVFCVINIVALLAIDTVTGAAATAVNLVFPDLVTVANLQAGLRAWDPYWLTVIVGLTVIKYGVYGSMIAVPMVAAAAAGTKRGTDTGIFFGLGAGVVSLTFITVVWAMAGNVFSFFGEVAVIFFMVITTIFETLRGDDLTAAWNGGKTMILVSALLMTWVSSWFYATAVLAWEKVTQQQSKAQNSAKETNRVSGDNLRTLREQRAQAQRDAAS